MVVNVHLNLYSVTTSLTALCYVALVFVLLRRRWRNTLVHQALCLYLLTMALWQAAYFMVSISDNPQTALFWYRVVVPVISGQFIIYFILTKALMQAPGSSAAVWGGVLVWAMMATASAVLDPTAIFSDIHRDAATGLFVPTFGPVLPVIAAPSYLYLAYSTVYLIRAYGDKPDLQRRRIQYLLLGIAVAVLGTVANFVPRLQPYPIDVIANLINAVIIAYAILRYQLLDLKFVVRRGLLHSIPTAIIGFSYFLISSLAVAWFHLVAGYQLLLALLIGAFTSAVAQPLRDKVQTWVDRHFFRDKYDSSLMLQRLSRTAASVIDLDRLIGTILDEVTTTMHVEKAAFFVKHEENGEFRLAARRGPDQAAEVVLRTDHPLVDWLSGHEQILTKREVEMMPKFRALWGRERDDLHEIGAELFIPLKVEGRLVGIFTLGPKLSEEAYPQDDQLTLTTLANQTAVAVENARLYATERRRLIESLILLDIATVVGSTLDLNQVLKLIARRTAEACGVHRCSILLLDEQRQRLLPVMSQFASEATDEQLWERYRSNTYVQTIDGIPVLHQVFQDRQPLVLDADTIGRLPDAWVTPFGVRSLLIVPLVSRDRVLGAMALDHVEDGKRFEQDQINLAMTIGSQAAAAIENARLYEQTIEEKAKTEIVLQETFSGIVVIDDSRRIVSMNPGAELITGFAAEQVQGKRITDVFGAEIADPGSPLVRACETGERVPPVETTLSASEGRKDILLGATPLSTEGKPPSRCLLSFADISKLKEVDRLKSNIVANVSHELRSPLSSIKAYAELLLLGAERTDVELRRNWLSVIDRETDRLTTVISNLLDLSRLESGRIELTKVPLHLEEVVDDAVALLQVQAEQRDIHIELNVQPGLPPLLAEEGLIRSVVRNLVSNAIKFNHDGAQVRISVSEDDGNLKLSVEDEGIGIPQDAIPHLFSKFFRVPSAAAVEMRGTGLGLALAREAVVAHGGRIEVDSTLGKGSRFTVIIPQTG
jgi:PAS domain S-box-containing protein